MEKLYAHITLSPFWFAFNLSGIPLIFTQQKAKDKGEGMR